MTQPDTLFRTVYGRNLVNELRHFVNCIETGAPCRADGRAGRRAVELVLASYRSAREGTKVALPM